MTRLANNKQENDYGERNQNTTSFTQEGFARLPQILHVLGISASAWWQGVKDGKYPQPVKLGPRTTVWRVEEIREIIRQVAAGAMEPIQ